MTTPRTVYDYNLSTGERVVKKTQPVLGGFSSDNYTTKRMWAIAGDGVEVPLPCENAPCRIVGGCLM